MLFLNAAIHAFHRLLAVGVRDQFAERAAILLSPGVGIEGCAGGALGDQILQVAGFDSHGTRQFQPIGLTAETVGELPGDATHLGKFLADVDRQANGAGTVVDRPRHSLTNPPVGIG